MILKLQTNYKLLANCIVQNAAWLSQAAGKAVSRQTERRIFQFNINEATSSNLHKVLTLLDPTFSPVMEVKEVPQFGKN